MSGAGISTASADVRGNTVGFKLNRLDLNPALERQVLGFRLNHRLLVSYRSCISIHAASAIAHAATSLVEQLTLFGAELILTRILHLTQAVEQ
jgi:hypothetical protein